MGFIFCELLSFDIHIQKCISKANQMIGLVKRTFSFLNRDIFLKLYKGLIRPHLEYGNLIWNPHLKRQSVAVERVQRRATKILKECQSMTYAERLQYFNLHSLKGRRFRGDLIETYKLFNNHVDVHWNTFFTNTPYKGTRNSEGKVFISHCRTNIRKNFFSNRVANNWNDLSPELKNAQNINTFKNQLDKEPKFIKLFYGFDE